MPYSQSPSGSWREAKPPPVIPAQALQQMARDRLFAIVVHGDELTLRKARELSAQHFRRVAEFRAVNARAQVNDLRDIRVGHRADQEAWGVFIGGLGHSDIIADDGDAMVEDLEVEGQRFDFTRCAGYAQRERIAGG